MRRRARRVFGWIVMAALGFGCGSEAPDAPPELFLSETNFDLGVVRGVTVDEAGEVFVLANNALFVREGESWSAAWAATGDPGVLLDVASLGEARFALTTRDMGYELDLETGVLTQHFCYEPGDDIRIQDPPQTPKPTVEISRSVAYDAEQGLLFANPQTVADDGSAEVFFSEIASFDRVTGQELTFRNLRDAGFSAGGLAVLEFPTLLAGEGSTLSVIDFISADKRAVLDLAVFDVQDIDGLALDRERGELLVVDAATHRLLVLDLALVEAAL